MSTSSQQLRGSLFQQPLLNLVQNHLISYPTPSNLSGNYNWGVLAGLCLVLQIVTGIFLQMHYTAHVDYAFDSVQHLMRDVPNGWMLRYLHQNGQSLFFIVVYMHLFRALYYTSYAQPREQVWLIGVVILLVMILTAFIGYVLPWGQMSLWGQTVITSLASALPVVGTSIVLWLWGGFSVGNQHLKALEYQGHQQLARQYLIPRSKDSSASYLRASASAPGTPIFLENSACCEDHFFHGKVHSSFHRIGIVKTLSIHSQFADVWAFHDCFIKKTISTVPASQRLNAEKYAWLIGFYEADGWVSTLKCGKYILYELGIGLHVRDMPLLYQINNEFQLSGSVNVRKDKPDIVYLQIRKKKVLIEKIVPIFDNFPMLGQKKQNYDWFRFHLIENKTIYHADLANFKFPLTAYVAPSVNQLLMKPYYDYWLIGFINGEGCFSTYLQKNKYMVCSFSVSQTVSGDLLLSTIRTRLKLGPQVYLHKETGNFKLKVTSQADCYKVLQFLRKCPVKLRGHKHVQFVQWVRTMRVTPRYSTLKIPNKLSILNPWKL